MCGRITPYNPTSPMPGLDITAKYYLNLFSSSGQVVIKGTTGADFGMNVYSGLSMTSSNVTVGNKFIPTLINGSPSVTISTDKATSSGASKLTLSQNEDEGISLQCNGGPIKLVSNSIEANALGNFNVVALNASMSLANDKAKFTFNSPVDNLAAFLIQSGDNKVQLGSNGTFYKNGLWQLTLPNKTDTFAVLSDIKPIMLRTFIGSGASDGYVYFDAIKRAGKYKIWIEKQGATYRGSGFYYTGMLNITYTAGASVPTYATGVLYGMERNSSSVITPRVVEVSTVSQISISFPYSVEGSTSEIVAYAFPVVED